MKNKKFRKLEKSDCEGKGETEAIVREQMNIFHF